MRRKSSPFHFINTNILDSLVCARWWLILDLLRRKQFTIYTFNFWIGCNILSLTFFPTCSRTCFLVAHTTTQNRRNRTKSSAIHCVKTSHWGRENSTFRCSEKRHNWRKTSWKHNSYEAGASYTVVTVEIWFLTRYAVNCNLWKSWRLNIASFWWSSGSMTSDVAQSFLMSRTHFSYFFQFHFFFNFLIWFFSSL